MTASVDAEFDVVVVGSGAAGLSAATTAAANGHSVLVLEKAASIGGTTSKSIGAVWLPNNRFLRASGAVDDRDECVRFLARVCRPGAYQPEQATLGLPAWEHEGLCAFVDNAAAAHEALEAWGALDLAAPAGIGVVDYLSQLPENTCPQGRTLYSAAVMGNGRGGGGQELVDGLAAAASRFGATLQVRSRTTGLLCDGERVVGVEYLHEEEPRQVRARRGVVFASGDFSHNAAMRLQYLGGPALASTTALTNTGDFIPLAIGVGAELANMSEAWLASGCLARLEADPATAFNAFYVLGDAMFMVNRHGRRVVNEKSPYNELGRVFTKWDEAGLEYSNSPLIAIWDERDAQTWGIDALGNPIAALGAEAPWVVTADTLEELTRCIALELGRLRHLTGPAPLHEDFFANLRETIAAMAHHAESGVDPDFHRGETPFEAYVSGRFGNGDGPNPVLRALGDRGPYFATVLGMGTIGTRGGPRTTPNGEVLHVSGRTIPGLYAVGSCAASPTGQGYPGAGTPLGFALTGGFQVGRHLTSNNERRTGPAEDLTEARGSGELGGK